MLLTQSQTIKHNPIRDIRNANYINLMFYKYKIDNVERWIILLYIHML